MVNNMRARTTGVAGCQQDVQHNKEYKSATPVEE